MDLSDTSDAAGTSTDRYDDHGDNDDNDQEEAVTFGPRKVLAAPGESASASAAVTPMRFRWLHALRLRTLPFVLVPTLVALELVWLRGVSISPIVAVGALAAVTLAQLGASLLDAYVEFERHAHEDYPDDDSADNGGLPTLLYRCGIYPLDALRLSVIFFTASVLVGLGLAVLGGPWVGVLGAAGLVGAVLYSSTNIALKRSPLADVLVLLALGPGLVTAIMIATGHAPRMSDILMALALGFFAAAPLQAVHLRDVERDRAYRMSTPGALTGHEGARILYTSTISAGFVLLLAAALPPSLPHGALLALLALPIAIIPINGVWRAGPPQARLQLVAQAASAYTVTGIWLIVGLLLNILILRLHLAP